MRKRKEEKETWKEGGRIWLSGGGKRRIANGREVEEKECCK